MRRTRHDGNGPLIWNTGALLLCALALAFVLAACASLTGSQGNTTATATPGTPKQAVNCGTLHSNYAGLLSSDKASAQQVESCFYHAYQQCQAATLTFQQTSIDSGSVNHLSVKSANGACVLSDGVQHFIAPKPPGGIITYTCASASMLADGLHIASCGDAGEVVIPLQ